MIKYSNAELTLIWLDSFVGLEYKHKRALFDKIKGNVGIRELIERSKDYMLSAIGEKEYSTILNSANKEYLDFVLNGLDKRGITAVTLASKDYPQSLLRTEIPPVVLYAKGDLTLLSAEIFGIVGSRKSLPLSISIAKDYANALGKHFTLCTGLAEGVDSAVLNECVEKGLKVISVLAGGLDSVYPKSNQALFDKVSKSGLVLAEYPPEVFPQPFMFPVRNRIIAGLSKGVLVVSGGLKSGTSYTAEYAEEYGKDLFAIPYSVNVTSGAGCNDLIKRGAILTDTPKDILEFYNVKEEQTPVQSLTDEEKGIISLLSDGEMHIDKICAQLNKRAFELLPLLSTLEIKGVIVKTGNVYGLCRSVTEE